MGPTPSRSCKKTLTALCRLAFAMLLVLGAVVPFLVAGAIPAAAQETCPDVGSSAISVFITSPDDGSTVYGVVDVSGRTFMSLLGPGTSQVELWIDGALVKTNSFDPVRYADFDFSWDSTAHGEGVADITVVACGDPTSSSPSRGQSNISVYVSSESPSPTPSVTLPWRPPTESPTPDPSPSDGATVSPSPSASPTRSTPSPSARPSARSTRVLPNSVFVPNLPSRIVAKEGSEGTVASVWIGVITGLSGAAGLGYALIRHAR